LDDNQGKKTTRKRRKEDTGLVIKGGKNGLNKVGGRSPSTSMTNVQVQKYEKSYEGQKGNKGGTILLYMS